MKGRRVVITGVGAITPVGNTVAATWDSLVNGRSGIGPITLMDVTDFPSRIAGEVKNFEPSDFIPAKEVRRHDRFSLFSMAASAEAWADAGLAEHSYEPTRMGVILGVGVGGLITLEENYREFMKGGPKKVSPFLIPRMISNLGPGNVAIKYNLQGMNYTVTSACTSGTHALGEACRLVAEGLQDVVVTGGTEAAITALGCAGFGKMKALSTRNDDPERASRPFDRDRDGFVIGEGAGILVVEDLESAKKRGAKIYAEVAGYGFSCDAEHITAPAEGGEGAIHCMSQAIEDSGLALEQIKYINAHGTSTPINDPAESRAIRKVFGTAADSGLCVSSTKSMTGHLLGAAGGIESVFLAKALETNTVPPTTNLENPDEDCDLDYVADGAREMSLEAVMSNSFGFGGTNASVVLKKL